MEKLFTVNKNKTGTDCGSDHELLIANVNEPLEHSGMT